MNSENTKMNLTRLKKHVSSLAMTQEEKDKEQYFTRSEITKSLLFRVSINGTIFEPCAGMNHITQVLEDFELRVFTNDIDEKMNTDFHFDASDIKNWDVLNDKIDWVVTNPPFSLAASILKHAYSKATVGVALLARLSFLEPCAGRDKFLVKNPPNKLIVLPRVSFTRDGGTDSVTVAWMIWLKQQHMMSRPIDVVLREMLHD